MTLPGYAQDKTLTDSLLSVLSGHRSLSEVERFTIYSEIAKNSSEPEQIIIYSTKAIELVKDESLDVRYEGTLLAYGEGLMLRGDLVNALKQFFTAAELYQKNGSAVGVATAYGYISRAYQRQNNQTLSVGYNKRAISILRSEKDTLRLASTLLNTGFLFLTYQQLDSALVYTACAEMLYNKIGYELGMAYAQGNSGLIFAAYSKDLQAEAKLKSAIKTLETFGDDRAIIDYSLELSAIYRKQSNYKKSLNYAESAYRLAVKNGYHEYIKDASHALSESYAITDNYLLAYKYQKQYLAYRDSIDNEKTIRKMADLRTAYEIAQKQSDIDHLQEEKHFQKLLMIGLASLIVMACLLIFLLYYYNIRKKSINTILAKQNGELEVQRNELQNLISIRNRFFSIISHDLRGPVNAFNGISSLIQHYISNNDLKQLGEVSEYIDKSASQLSSLLDNLLSWSVIQQGEFPYTPEKVSVKTLFNENVNIFKTMAHAKNIRLETFTEDHLTVWVDSNSMLTILRNLTSNALKFTKEGGSVTLSALERHGFVEIKVADTGIGMPPERLESLFTHREEKRTWGTAGEKGLGIGLRLAYDFAVMNKGTIEVNSQEGVGTQFIVKIPIVSTSDPALRT